MYLVLISYNNIDLLYFIVSFSVDELHRHRYCLAVSNSILNDAPYYKQENTQTEEKISKNVSFNLFQ